VERTHLPLVQGKPQNVANWQHLLKFDHDFLSPDLARGIGTPHAECRLELGNRKEPRITPMHCARLKRVEAIVDERLPVLMPSLMLIPQPTNRED
jgi:hypothetical protein